MKNQEVEKIVNVDIDEVIVNLAKNNPILSEFNGYAFSNPKIQIIIEDAFLYVRNSTEKFDVVIVDFPEGVDNYFRKQFRL